MFDNLTDSFVVMPPISVAVDASRRQRKDTLREVRMALLEADVALPVVREFINRVKRKRLVMKLIRA